MSLVPLRIGALDVPGFVARRSGLRWLVEDGHPCRPGEVIAYCNVTLVPTDLARRDPPPFAEEARDFQIAFAPRLGGRLHRAPGSSRGGFLDQLPFYQLWAPDFAIGQIQSRPADRPQGHYPNDDTDTVRLLLVAGRRATEIAKDHSGLLTGWHDRARAWWGDGEGTFGTLLSLGICEQEGVIRGVKGAFLEFFEAVPGPAHVVLVADDMVKPCAAVTIEQCVRTAAQSEEIIADFTRSFADCAPMPTPADWIVASSMMAALVRSPLTDHYALLTRGGLRQVGPADAVVLSLNSETAYVLRHKRLGYTLLCHQFRVVQAGPALRAWFKTNFERVLRTVDDVRSDLRALVTEVRARSDMKFLMMNVMSTSGQENVTNYAPYEQPLGNTLESVRCKELTLMLHDFAREADVAIVDVDAIAADYGASSHLPDGVHQSGPVQAEVRSEIVRILRDRGVAGFAPQPLR